MHELTLASFQIKAVNLFFQQQKKLDDSIVLITKITTTSRSTESKLF